MVLGALILNANVISLFGIFEFLNFRFIKWYTFTSGIISFQDNPIFLGEYISAVLCISVSLLFYLKGKYIKQLLFVSVFLQSICLLLASSKGPILSFFACFIFIGFLYKHLCGLRFLRVIYMAVAIMLVIILSSGIINVFEKISRKSFNLKSRAISAIKLKDVSLEHRILMLKVGWEMVKDNPIKGFGVGTLMVFYPLYHNKFLLMERFNKFKGHMDYIHNEFLQFWIEMGIIGFIIYILFFVLLVHSIFKSSSKTERQSLQVAITFFSGTVSIYISSLFCYPLHVSATSVLFFFCLGMCMSTIYGEELKILNYSASKFSIYDSQVERFSFKKLFYRSLLGLFVIILGFKAFDEIKFYHFLKNGMYFRDRKHLNKSNYYFLKAEKLMPYNYDALFEIANNYLSLNDIENAKVTLIKILEYYPFNEFALINLSRLYLEEANFDKVLHYSQRGIEVNPTNEMFYLYIGNAYFNKNNFKQAILNYKKVVCLQPKISEVYYNIGLAFYKQNNFELAVKYFKKAIALDRYAYYYINLGKAYARMGEMKVAEKCFWEAIFLSTDKEEKKKLMSVIKIIKEGNQR